MFKTGLARQKASGFYIPRARGTTTKFNIVKHHIIIDTVHCIEPVHRCHPSTLGVIMTPPRLKTPPRGTAVYCIEPAHRYHASSVSVIMTPPPVMVNHIHNSLDLGVRLDKPVFELATQIACVFELLVDSVELDLSFLRKARVDNNCQLVMRVKYREFRNGGHDRSGHGKEYHSCMYW